MLLFVLPREFPHKPWTGASFEQRITMLRRIAGATPGAGVAVSEGGLYIEMGREAQALFPNARVELVLGRDAAERIATWEYDEPGVFEQLLHEFTLRVAPRAGVFEGAAKLEISAESQAISATEVRRRIVEGEPWQELVPPEITDLVEAFYR